MTVRIPFAIVRGLRLRVCIYARFSTDEQDETSITDQIRLCRKLLESFDIECEIIEYSDSAMSGELRDRPGINQVREAVEARRIDLLICEDSSRVFRNETACFELVETAVDLGVRVICIGDDVDTAEEGWDERLHDAQRHHSRSNYYLRRRLNRKVDSLWEMGAAVVALHPGHTRKPTVPARDGEPAEGPFFDEIDPRWKPVIYGAYERVANHEPVWLVGNWLSEQGLPKRSKNSDPSWTAKDVIALIRRKIYRGVEEFGVTVTVKKHRTGKSTHARNDPKNVRTRPMKHLAIVPDWLWQKANAAIDSRKTRPDPPHGAAHPLSGIPRDSRGPLSTLFVCDVCGGKMHATGRTKGGYRCSCAHGPDCWCKATAERSVTHSKISQAIIGQLEAFGGALESIVREIEKMPTGDKYWQDEEAGLLDQERKLQAKCIRLGDLIDEVDEAAPHTRKPKTLLNKLCRLEYELEQVQATLEEFRARRAATVPVPSQEQIERSIRDSVSTLLQMNRCTRVLLERLVPGKIRAVPYQQFDSAKVVLRAEFSLNLIAAMPEQWIASLNQSSLAALADKLPPISVVVDLFEPSNAPAFAMRVMQLSEQKNDRGKMKTFEEIGKELGISKRSAHLAVELGRKMRAAGITDPYIRLSAPPDVASRWGSRNRPSINKRRSTS